MCREQLIAFKIKIIFLKHNCIELTNSQCRVNRRPLWNVEFSFSIKHRTGIFQTFECLSDFTTQNFLI